MFRVHNCGMNLRRALTLRAYASVCSPSYLQLEKAGKSLVRPPGLQSAVGRSSFEWVTPMRAHIRGQHHPELLSSTIGDFFDRQVALHPNRTALHVPFQDVKWSWLELQQRVNAAASGLVICGFQKGDRLAVWMLNNSEWLVLQLATAKIGVILVNLNTSYTSTELLASINAVKCKAIVLSSRLTNESNPYKPTHLKILQQALPDFDLNGRRRMGYQNAPSLLKIILVNDKQHEPAKCSNPLEQAVLHFEDLSKMGSSWTNKIVMSTASHQHTHDPINIQFTSGTTDHPKGVTLSHHNILNNAFFTAQRMKLSSEDVCCIPVPLFHCLGMVMGNLAAISHGATIVYPNDWFQPEKVLSAVERFKCSAVIGVPTMFNRILSSDHFSKYDSGSLRTGIIAGSVCPATLVKRIRTELGVKDLTVCYGMTETSPVSFQTPVEGDDEKHETTVGTILPWLEAKVVREDGEVAAVDEPGELLIRGYSVMKGYWGAPGVTRSAICPDQWMRTGDLAMIDSGGYASIVGRLKDIIIRGGENIYPSEIEDVLYTHPHIADSAVVGVESTTLGEEVCAWVKVKEGCTMEESEVQEHCRKTLSSYKIPKYVIFRDEFPVTANGKHQKTAIRALTHQILDA